MADIGTRNHRAMINNGRKVVDRMEKVDSDLAYLAKRYEMYLQHLDLIFRAANLLENDHAPKS